MLDDPLLRSSGTSMHDLDGPDDAAGSRCRDSHAARDGAGITNARMASGASGSRRHGKVRHWQQGVHGPQCEMDLESEDETFSSSHSSMSLDSLHNILPQDAPDLLRDEMEEGESEEGDVEEGETVCVHSSSNGL